MATEMNIRFLFAILSVVLSQPFFAQEKKLDSLHAALKQMPDDATRVNRLNNITYGVFKVGQYDRTMATSERAAALAAFPLFKSVHYKIVIASVFSSLGNVYELKSDNNQILFSIHDEGRGLSFDDKVHLFENLKRLSDKPTPGESSTGLGPSIAKTLVEGLHGGVLIDSVDGKGSAYTILLPAFNLTYASSA